MSVQASKKLRFIERRTPDLGGLTNSYLFQHVHSTGHAVLDQDLWMFLLRLLEGDRQDNQWWLEIVRLVAALGATIRTLSSP